MRGARLILRGFAVFSRIVSSITSRHTRVNVTEVPWKDHAERRCGCSAVASGPNGGLVEAIRPLQVLTGR